jgi:hypothetical protein
MAAAEPLEDLDARNPRGTDPAVPDEPWVFKAMSAEGKPGAVVDSHVLLTVAQRPRDWPSETWNCSLYEESQKAAFHAHPVSLSLRATFVNIRMLLLASVVPSLSGYPDAGSGAGTSGASFRALSWPRRDRCRCSPGPANFAYNRRN